MEGERVMTKQLLEIAEPRAWPTFRMLRVLYSHLGQTACLKALGYA